MTIAPLPLTPLRPEDASTLEPWLLDFLRQHNQVWAEGYGLGWSPNETDAQLFATGLLEEHLSMVYRSARNPNHFVRVLRDEGKAVGIVWAHTRMDGYLKIPIGVLAWIYLDPSQRGRGLGKALLASAQSWLSELRIKAWEVRVLSDNPAAQALYRSMGLRTYDVRMLGPTTKPDSDG